MKDALDLFEEVCDNRHFSNVAMLLFLNKRDLFAAKVAEVPIGRVWKRRARLRRAAPAQRGQRLPGLRRQSERLRRRRPLLHGQVPAEEQGPGADDLLPRHVRDGHVQRASGPRLPGARARGAARAAGPRGHGHVLPRHHPEEHRKLRLDVMRRPPPRRPRGNPKSPCPPCIPK